MRWMTLALCFLSLVALSVWVGGFTFYGGVVVPQLHESMESLDAGLITQRVTDPLNAIGAAALIIGWVWACVDRMPLGRRWRIARLGLLGSSSALLVFLVALHRVMDQRLDSGSMTTFYPLHRAYLIASTAQWVANLGLLLVHAARSSSPPSERVDSATMP